MSGSGTKQEGAVQSVIRRIRKLMSYAADPAASAGEIENAIGHARRLMDQFHLDEAAVTAADESASAIGGEEVIRRRRWVDRITRDLARVPCIVCDVECCCQIVPEERTLNERLIFFGFVADVAVAKALYLELLAAMRTRARRSGCGGSGPAFNSFAAGFTVRLIHRALLAKKDARESARTGAIVLARENRVHSFLRELQVQPPKPLRPRKVRDGEAFYHGARAADDVSLGTNQLAAGGRQQSLFGHGG